MTDQYSVQTICTNCHNRSAVVSIPHGEPAYKKLSTEPCSTCGVTGYLNVTASYRNTEKPISELLRDWGVSPKSPSAA